MTHDELEAITESLGQLRMFLDGGAMRLTGEETCYNSDDMQGAISKVDEIAATLRACKGRGDTDTQAAERRVWNAAIGAAANQLFMFSEPGMHLEYSLADEIAAVRDLQKGKAAAGRKDHPND